MLRPWCEIRRSAKEVMPRRGALTWLVALTFGHHGLGVPIFDPARPDLDPGPKSNAQFVAPKGGLFDTIAKASEKKGPVFTADLSLLPPKSGCRRTPAEAPLKRLGIRGEDCAFMPLARPEPYQTQHLAMLTDVIVVLNRSLHHLHPDTAWDVMPWAGSLLGAYRNNDVISHTFDGDVLVPAELATELKDEKSSVVDALFESGIYSFTEQATLRFCYHERAPCMSASPGAWGLCGSGGYINSREHTYIDGYEARLVDSQVHVQYHDRLECVTAEELLPTRANEELGEYPSLVTIRGTDFVAPSATAKVITALYGWDWQRPDSEKRGGGDRPEEKGDVCNWPHRPPE